jgi:threonine dehydrogenase-like Zn-dependent dehydrogenase
VGGRAYWAPKTVLVIGAGPIGLLGALLGRQLGLKVHVLDRNETGPKPELVRALWATYHTGSVSNVGFEPDIIMECTGAGQLVRESLHIISASGVVCLTGVGHGGQIPKITTAGEIASAAVLKNNVVIGSVNANKRHWYKAAEALARADASWLEGLITRRERPETFAQALVRNSADIKVVMQFSEA